MTDIVDAHHHIWRQADLPWLIGPMQPRIFGPYEPIRRDYPIEEFLDDLAGSGVDELGLCADQLGQRPLRGRGRLGAADRERARLAARASSPMPTSASTTSARSSTAWRAIRWCAACACNCTGTRTRSTALPRGPTSAPTRRSGAMSRRLADYGWSFDLQVFAPQMADAAGLAEACPDVTFVLQHAGMLEDLSPEGRAAWRAGMTRLARLPERRLEAFRPRHLHPSQRSRRTSPRSCATPSRSSAPTAACSAPIFRSRNSGPAIATWSTPIAPRRPIFAPSNATPFCSDTAARVYRLGHDVSMIKTIRGETHAA